ncbi:hypothetical protein D9599_27945 [Roseomonas sp. KE2513]|nr:hypothetical protein [Roseomonas sp. KE2513]
MADKLRILAECDGPGVQVSEMAARHAVYRGLMCQWRRQARGGLLVARPPPEFVPVRVATADCHSDALAELEPVSLPAPSPRVATAIEIELPGGIRGRVGEKVGLVALRRVPAALRA